MRAARLAEAAGPARTPGISQMLGTGLVNAFFLVGIQVSITLCQFRTPYAALGL